MKKILIAEDDQFISKIMVYRLKSEGYQVDRVSDGQEALKMIEADGYDVVLLDLIMPVLDGFGVLRALKTKKIKTPIIVFSNLSQPEDKKEALELGAKAYFIKSDMAIDELSKKIHSLL